MQDIAAEGAKRPSFLSHLFSDRRIAPMLVLGFASGIPFQLVYITQSAWLYEAKVPIATIGLMSELTLAVQVQIRLGAVSRSIRRAYLQPPFGATARMDRRFPTWRDGGAGRGRPWRSRALAGLDGGVLPRARLRGSDPGRGDRWLAHQRRAGRTTGVDGLMVGGWLSRRRPRGSELDALLLADRVGWRAAYPLHGSLDDAGHARGLLRPRA